MARIEPPRRPPLWIRGLFLLSRKLYGKTFWPLQMAAHVPSFILPFLLTRQFGHGGGTLSADTRMLAMQLVGELNQCAWCVDYGRSLAGSGMGEKIAHVLEFETQQDFSEAERAALRYAGEATQTPVVVTDETFAALRPHFTDRQIVELTFAVAIENFFNRVNAPLGIEAQGFCAIPDRRAMVGGTTESLPASH